MRHIEEIITRQIHNYNQIQRLLEAGKKPKLEKPQRPAICIARKLGAGAREVAKILGDRLNYEIYGKNLIDEVANDMRVQRMVIDGLDETADPEFAVLLRTLGDGHQLASGEYFASLMRIVRALVRDGGVILLGRGSHMIAGNTAGLRVQLTASDETCIRRIRAYQPMEHDAAAAQLEESKLTRMKFMRRYFKRSAEDATLFDLTLNTDRIEPAQAAEIILNTMKLRGFPEEKLRLKPAAKPAARDGIVTSRY